MAIDAIDLIVGAALLLFGLLVLLRACSPGLRERMERPKHVFLAQTQAYDENRSRQSGSSPMEP